jgi:hypothetical protein
MYQVCCPWTEETQLPDRVRASLLHHGNFDRAGHAKLLGEPPVVIAKVEQSNFLP